MLKRNQVKHDIIYNVYIELDPTLNIAQCFAIHVCKWEMSALQIHPMGCDVVFLQGHIFLSGQIDQLQVLGLLLVHRQNESGIEAEDGRVQNVHFGKESLAGSGNARVPDFDVTVIKNVSWKDGMVQDCK